MNLNNLQNYDLFKNRGRKSRLFNKNFLKAWYPLNSNLLDNSGNNNHILSVVGEERYSTYISPPMGIGSPLIYTKLLIQPETNSVYDSTGNITGITHTNLTISLNDYWKNIYYKMICEPPAVGSAFSGCINIPSSSSLTLGNNNFTLECIFKLNGLFHDNNYLTNPGVYNSILMQRMVSPRNGSWAWGLRTTAAGLPDGMYFQWNVSDVWYYSTRQAYSFSLGSVYHVAITRSGTTIRFFVNGSLIYTGTCNANLSASTAMPIFTPRADLYACRIVNGSALYTSSFSDSLYPFYTY